MSIQPSDETVQVKSLLCAAPANRFSSCSILLQLKQSIFVIFGVGQQIAIWNCTDPYRFPPLKLLKSHQAQVTVIKKLGVDSSGFVSGDLNGVVLVWMLDGDQWKVVASLTDHKRSISTLSSIRLPVNHHENPSEMAVEYLIFSGASDGFLISWKLAISSSFRSLESVELSQKIQLTTQIALDSALVFLPGQSKDLILALGLTDGKIAIYLLALPSLLFDLCCSLPGHTDWIRCLDFTLDPKEHNDLLLVSGSQDHFIRIWRCHKTDLQLTQPHPNSTRDLSTEDPFQALDELTQSLKEEGQIINSQTLPFSNRQAVEMKKYHIKDTGRSFVSDALLLGHEGWITNVRWCISPSGTLQLLSTSSDRSMIMWRQSEEFDNFWLNVERFGELGTSTNLSLFGAHYFIGPSDQSETVLASGWTRAWHRWGKLNKAVWEPKTAPTGHYAGVTGLDWDKEGEYLLSCANDQTTRLWGFWNGSQNSSESKANSSWYEICRPQSHGHDLFGVSFIGDCRSRFVSISEEKVIRVFEMTQDFVKAAEALGVTRLPLENRGTLPQRATVPPLGLSNRIEKPEEAAEDSQDHSAPQTCPPFEDQLLSRTLWPEIDKIYGHPSELSTITTSHCGKMIASACHATSIQTASIRLHSTENFSPIKPGVLEAHQLTVTRLAFSFDDSRLLSVSRDRSWTVWKRLPAGDGFEMEQRMEKAHARIIWDACWATLSMFITGSRDKSIKTWVQSNQQGDITWNLGDVVKCDQPIKSCAISPHPLTSDKMILAIGLEDGVILMYSQIKAGLWEHLTSVTLSSMFHTAPINRLSFSPKLSQFGKLRLATGGEDGIVKVVDLDFKIAG